MIELKHIATASIINWTKKQTHIITHVNRFYCRIRDKYFFFADTSSEDVQTKTSEFNDEKSDGIFIDVSFIDGSYDSREKKGEK